MAVQSPEPFAGRAARRRPSEGRGPGFAALADRLGLEDPAGRDLLAEALTHQSAASRPGDSNQRLEFLGDRVLGLVVAEELSRLYPEESESLLAPRLNQLVRREACAECAVRLDLGEHLRMARSEVMTGGKRKLTLLADSMEAVIAAVYLARGLLAARDFVLDLWAPLFAAQDAPPQDSKTRLQEWAQARALPPPSYDLVARDGPDHAPHFTISARLSDGRSASGRGASKRAAEQVAASALLTLLRAGDAPS
ncbi:ribonuclease III [Neomegalonema perideroedes]|uniref:ribonuclease III n=1 Tax=Neomegalonema perideroedes TaxID=217219 RepID=UPI0003629567|nr:ribonuclease III [Neomegalonema perideroedes]